MITYIFSIYDKAVQAFPGGLFEARTKGEAIRMFTDNVNSKDSMLNRHPGDYSLSHLGSFNSATGELTAADAQTKTGVHVINALEVLKKD